MGVSIRTSYCACLERLLELEAPSRLAARDATLYDFSDGTADYAARFLGWTSLCSKPPMSAEDIARQATDIRQEGIEAVVLIAQGGSSQASMTITKLHEVSTGRADIAFRTMDSLSPVFVRHILESSDPAKTLYIVSSKSGSTVEPLALERVTWRYVADRIGTKQAAERFVAITDPGSSLEHMARTKNYRLVLSGPTDVGGRFSALTVFSLFPAALVGIDIANVVATVAQAERQCSENSKSNPALDLACFLYENYGNGRDKVSLVMPPSGQVFGLWIEQLLAESLGKEGMGILPNVEVDPSILSIPRADRCVISYCVGHPEGFSESLEHFDASIPAKHHDLDTMDDLFTHFIIWKYAIAFLGILFNINPFDQPDVEDTKKRVITLLSGTDTAGSKEYLQIDYPYTDYIHTVRIGNALIADDTMREEFSSVDFALRTLLEMISDGDYFSLNAFLPFREYGRREALERMRHRVASRIGAASCLEIGSRYLHSTGQLHKGGPNNGVFLYLSANEENDISVPGENYTLGDLATTQAHGDFEALASRGRRVIQVHLANNSPETLSRFADRFCLAISAIKRTS